MNYRLLTMACENGIVLLKQLELIMVADGNEQTGEKLSQNIYKINNAVQPVDLFSKILENLEEETSIVQIDDSVTLRLFYSLNESTPKWKSFFNGYVDDDAPITQVEGKSESFILTCQITESSNIYLIAGGTGYFRVSEYIQGDFGIDLISRIIDIDDKIINHTKEKNVTGTEVGTARFFRKDLDLQENEKFGVIYKELATKLPKEKLTQFFGFNEDEIGDSTSCIAKSSFKVSKSIPLLRMIELMKSFEYVIQHYESQIINSVVKVEKTSSELLKKLELKMFIQLYRRFKGKSNAFQFDISPKDFELYFGASTYKVIRKSTGNNIFPNDYSFEELDDVEHFYAKLRIDNPTAVQALRGFIKFIKSLKIESYDSEGNKKTKANFIDHIFSEVRIDGDVDTGKYFLIDGSWYFLEKIFSDGLNEKCKEWIDRSRNRDLNNVWNINSDMDVSENQYNREYFTEVDFLVLDKVVPENIELADLIKIEEDQITLYHVKKRFGNTMRDLCYQVLISSKRFYEDSIVVGANNCSYLKMIYSSLLSRRNSSNEYSRELYNQLKGMSQEEFVAQFKGKSIKVVLAVADTTIGRDITDISKYGSTIAKFCLWDLVQSMKSLPIDFEICQIPTIDNVIS